MPDRKTLKIRYPTAGRFESFKRAHENQTAALARLLDEAGVPEEPEWGRCEACEAALAHGFARDDDGRPLCFACAGIDPEDFPVIPGEQ